MTSGHNTKKIDSNNSPSGFFIEPEEAALLGFSIDDVVEDENSMPPPQSRSRWGSWLAIVALIVLIILLAGGVGLFLQGQTLQGQVDELNRQWDKGTEDLALINSRLDGMENGSQDPPQDGQLVEHLPILADLIITSAPVALTANERDQAQLTVELLDNQGARYLEPVQIIAFVEGEGRLLYEGRVINNEPVAVLDGVIHIIYEAGRQSGPVEIHVQTEGLEEKEYPLVLAPLLPDRVELEFFSEELITNGTEQVTMTITLISDHDQQLVDETEFAVSLMIEPDLFPNLVRNHTVLNGELIIDTGVPERVEEDTQVQFTVSIDGGNNQIRDVLLTPDVRPFSFFQQCITTGNVMFREPSLNGGEEDLIFPVPANRPVGCATDDDYSTEPYKYANISIVLWVPEELVIDNELAVTYPITAYIGTDVPTGESLTITLEDVGAAVETGPKHEGLVQVLIEGSVWDKFLKLAP